MAACPQNSVIILDNLDGRTNLCVRKIFMGAMVGYLAVAPTVEMLGGFTSVSIAPFCRVAVRVAYYKSQKLISYQDTAQALDGLNEPVKEDYVCLTVDDSDRTMASDAGYQQVYVPTIVLA